MEMTRFGVVVKVNDLDGCRQFYRDLLALGDPVMDSSFAVEFKVNGDFLLRLEQCDGRYLEHESAAVGFILEVDDLEKLRERLDYAGYELARSPEEMAGGFCFRGFDPERNSYFVIEAKEKPAP